MRVRFAAKKVRVRVRVRVVEFSFYSTQVKTGGGDGTVRICAQDAVIAV